MAINKKRQTLGP